MKKITISLLLISGIFLIGGCDSKEAAKQIAMSTYNELENKYNNLFSKYNILNSENKRLNKKINDLKQQNHNLSIKNQKLKQKIKQYVNGFQSMYK